MKPTGIEPDRLIGTVYHPDCLCPLVTVSPMSGGRIVIAAHNDGQRHLPPLDGRQVEQLIAALVIARMQVAPAVRPRARPSDWTAMPSPGLTVEATPGWTHWGDVDIGIGHRGLGVITFPITRTAARDLFDSLWQVMLELDEVPVSAGWRPPASKRRHTDPMLSRRSRAANDNRAA